MHIGVNCSGGLTELLFLQTRLVPHLSKNVIGRKHEEINNRRSSAPGSQKATPERCPYRLLKLMIAQNSLAVMVIVIVKGVGVEQINPAGVSE